MISLKEVFRNIIKSYKDNIESYGLTFKVTENVAVHEDIKLGLPSRDKYIDNYITRLKNLSKANIEIIRYNFMPIFDWTSISLNAKATIILVH